MGLVSVALNTRLVIAFSFVARLILIAYGEWQDRVMRVKYTDIDYVVFSDAAVHVAKGESPYRRDTYRYTPLLAFLLTPNVAIHPAFGKVLFSAFDVAAGYLIFAILRTRQVPIASALLASSLWLFNPLPMAVSTRGNAEAVMATLVLAVIYYIVQKKIIAAAFLFGLAVHAKTYPIIYAPSIYLLLNDVNKRRGDSRVPKTVKLGDEGTLRRLLGLLVPSKQCLLFATISTSVLAFATLAFYALYGEEFLMETYWYHVTRKDLQHNFSVYFYLLRLAENLGPAASTVVGLMAFLPQALATVAFSVRYFHDLPLAWFTVTAAFVTFNKVCTSQYFLWYLCLLPLVVPQLIMSIKSALTMCTVWFAAQGAWLLPAYYYEFEKKDVLIYVWLASLAFMATNIWCLWQLVASAHDTPLFDDGGRVAPVQAVVAERQAARKQR